MKKYVSDNYFWAGWGLVAFFFQLPLTKMILDDRQSLFLGVWDWGAFLIFISTTFFLIPLLFGIVLVQLKNFSPLMGRVFFGIILSYLISIQLHYFILEKTFQNPVFTLLTGAIIFSLLCGLYWVLTSFLIDFFKLLSFVTVGAFVFFFWNAAPIKTSPSKSPTKGAASLLSSDAPIFFLTFEKLATPYVADENRNILAKEFPHLAQLVSESDYYANFISNSMGTLFALQSMYSGRFSKGMWTEKKWNEIPHLKGLLSQNRETFFIMDLLGSYCDPRVDNCFRSFGVDSLSRFDLMWGWYKTFLQTILPKSFQKPLGLFGWQFDPRVDLWDRELNQQAEGENMLLKVGIRQFKFLKDILAQEGTKPNLYVMHNWMTDSPPIESSVLTGRTPAVYEAELRKVRKQLAAFDVELGKFISLLKKVGLYDPSLIVLASDTGYDAEVRNLEGQDSIQGSDDLLRTLFLIKRPQQKRGRRMESLMRQIDVLPTILSHLNMIPEAFGFEGVPVTEVDDGVSLEQRPVKFHVSVRTGHYNYRLVNLDGLLERIK